MQVVVYPDNTVCVDGKFLRAGSALFLVRLRRIKKVRAVLRGKIDGRVKCGKNSYMIFRNREVKNQYSL